MPKVPVYDERKVNVAAMPGARQSANITSADFGGAEAQVMRQSGQSLQQSSNEMLNSALRQQKDLNEAAVWKAYTDLSTKERDYLYNPETGLMNKRGSDALGASTFGAKTIGSMAEKISGGLENDEQRRLFQKMYQRRMDSTLDGLSRFESEQRRTYQDQVAGGVIKSAQQDAASRWNDPGYINQTAEIASLAMKGNLLSKGMPAEAIDAEVKALQSGIWKESIQAAVASSPLQAKQLLEQNRDKLTGSDVVELEKYMKTPLLAAQANVISQQVVSGRSTLPAPVSSLIAKQAQAQGVDVNTALMIAQIENGKGDPNAKNPNSSAKGLFQFVDKTWAAEGGTAADRGDVNRQAELGIQHIKKNTQALTETLGRAPTPAEVYLAHQQGLGGAKALLSADPNMSAVDALRRAYNGDFVTATAAIVNNGGNANMTAGEFVEKWNTKVARRTGAAGGSEMTLSDKLTAAKALAGGDPDLEKVTVAQVTQQHNAAEAVRKDEADTAMERIYGHVLQTGTYQGAAPADLAKLSSKQLLDLQDKARSTKTDWTFYDSYMGMSPADKAKVPLDQLMTKLGPAEMKVAIQERNGGKAGGTKQPWLQERATILKNYAQEAGVLPAKDKDMNTTYETSYNALSSYMNTRMQAYRDKNGKEMPETEFRQEAARAMTRVVTGQGSLLGFKIDETSRVFELNGKPITKINSVSDIPAMVRSQIETKLRSEGRQVTDGALKQIASAWVRGDRQGMRLLISGTPLESK
jgi:hypothetical protein